MRQRYARSNACDWLQWSAVLPVRMAQESWARTRLTIREQSSHVNVAYAICNLMKMRHRDACPNLDATRPKPGRCGTEPESRSASRGVVLCYLPSEKAVMPDRCTGVNRDGRRCGVLAQGSERCQHHQDQRLTESDWVDQLPIVTSHCLALTNAGKKCQYPSLAGRNYCAIPSHQDLGRLGGFYQRRHLPDLEVTAAPEEQATSNCNMAEAASSQTAAPQYVSALLEEQQALT